MRKLFEKYPLSALLLLAFVLRIININFPYFTSQEAAIALQIREWLPLLGEMGVRMPFILLGTLLVYLTYKLSGFFLKKPQEQFIAAFLVSISPPLIFFSKIPNTAIIAADIVLTFFYLFVVRGISKLSIFTTGLLILILFRELFLSLSNGFGDIQIDNGINVMRGYGLEAGWPIFVVRLLFSKLEYLKVGFLHWLTSISPAVLFGKFDQEGIYSFGGMGLWEKILILPFVSGIVYLINNWNRKNSLLLFLPLLITFPILFTYPDTNLILIVSTIPFLAVIMALGLSRFSVKTGYLIILISLIELILNLLYRKPDILGANMRRPGWVREIAEDVAIQSKTGKVLVSDNIVGGIPSFIDWYSKERERLPDNISVFSSPEANYYGCTSQESKALVVSDDDLKKMIISVNPTISNIYKDFFGKDTAYLIPERVCLK